MEHIHEEKYKGYTIRIYTDDDACNPREDFENMGTMVCFHRRYTLGDKSDLVRDSFGSWDEIKEHLKKQVGADIVLPIYMYEHGGVTIKTTPFGCAWDSGQVGFIYASKGRILEYMGEKEFTERVKERAAKLLEGEVKTYDDYLKGNVYGYRVLDEDGEERDACWGYFGDYEEKGGCLDEAKAVINHLAKKDAENPPEVRRVLPELKKK